jgi:hypothetical protein
MMAVYYVFRASGIVNIATAVVLGMLGASRDRQAHPFAPFDSNALDMAVSNIDWINQKGMQEQLISMGGVQQLSRNDMEKIQGGIGPLFG